MNSGMYGACRMIHGLSQEGYALKKFQYLTKNGIPIFVILMIFGIFLLGAVLNYFYHEKLFSYCCNGDICDSFCVGDDSTFTNFYAN